MNLASGHSINDGYLGFRPVGEIRKDTAVIISFDSASNLPLIVHDNMKHIDGIYGYASKNGLTVKQIIDAGREGIRHCRCTSVILRFFNSITERSIIEEHNELARETSGADRAFKICQEENAKHSSREIWVSFTGRFPDDGGIEGIDYSVETSLTKATRKKIVGKSRLFKNSRSSDSDVDRARRTAKEAGDIFIGLFIPRASDRMIVPFGNEVLVKHSGVKISRSEAVKRRSA